MKQFSRILCFSICISIVLNIKLAASDLIADSNKDLSGQGINTLLDDVTDLNELSEDLKQAYMKSHQEQQQHKQMSSDSSSDEPATTTDLPVEKSSSQTEEEALKINHSTNFIQEASTSTESTLVDNNKLSQLEETTTLAVSTETTSVYNPSQLNEPQTSTFESEQTSTESTNLDNLIVKSDDQIATVESATEAISNETTTEETIVETTTGETIVETTTGETIVETTTEETIVETTTGETIVETTTGETIVATTAVEEAKQVEEENVKEVEEEKEVSVQLESTTSSVEITSETPVESSTEADFVETKSLIVEEIKSDENENELSKEEEKVETTTVYIETNVELGETSTQMTNFDQNPVLFEPSVVTKEIESLTVHEQKEEEEVTTRKSFLSSRRFRNSLKTHSEEEEDQKQQPKQIETEAETIVESSSVTNEPVVEESTTQDYYNYSSHDNNVNNDTVLIDANQTQNEENVVTLTNTNEPHHNHHHHQHTLENLNQDSQILVEQEEETHFNSNESSNIAIDPTSHSTGTLLDTNSHEPAQVKYCADFKPIKELLNEQIRPVISLLPEGVQLTLLDETHIGGLNKGVCFVLISILCVLFACWYAYLRRQHSEQHKQTVLLNEKMLAIENNLKKMLFEKQTFESEYNDLEVKYAEIQTRMGEREEKTQQMSEKFAQLNQTNSLNQKELEKLRSTETALTKELNLLKIELARLKESQQNEQNECQIRVNSLSSDYEMRINQLTSKITDTEGALELSVRKSVDLDAQIVDLKENESKLNEQLEAKEKLVQMLQNSLLQLSKKDIEISTELTNEPLVVVNNSATQPQTFDGLIKMAELQMDIKNLEDQLTSERAVIQHKTSEIADLEERFGERQILIEKLEQRLKEVEKTTKDQEMQIRLLNELREKDTKQHLKALSDLDSQLKKKSNDADKVSHFLDQLRVKQERIQELESQFARIERQANQERQQFEKQTHENWLLARKIEKELKESKIEVTSLKERCAELEVVNKNLTESYNLMKQSTPGKTSVPHYMSPGYVYQQQQLVSASQVSRRSTEASLKDAPLSEQVESETKVDQPLQLDTLIENRQASSSSPSASSTSGAALQAQNMPHMYPPYMMRPGGIPPYRYPFPMPSPAATAAYLQQQQQQQQQAQLNDSTSSNANDASASALSTPNRSMVPPAMYPAPPPTGYPPIPPYRINPMLFQQQQQYLHQQYQQYQQSKSASSSQQPSPGANTSLPYSHTYPGYLNDSTNLNRETQNNIEEAVNEAAAAASEDPSHSDRQSTTSNSNLNQSNFNV